MFFDDFRPWRCKNVVKTTVFSSKGINMALNTVFLDVFDPNYLTCNNNNNNNNNNKKKKKKKKKKNKNKNKNNNKNKDKNNNNNNNNNKKKTIWHLVTLVRADPAAERREYHYFWDMSKYVTMYRLDSYKLVPEVKKTNVAGPNFTACTDTDTHLPTWR